MMMRKIAPLLACALFLGAAAKPAPKRASPRATTATPKAKAVPAPEGDFDARNPSGLIETLAALDAKAEVVKTEGDGVILKVTSPAGAFQALYGGCDAHGRACAALQFDALAQARTATLGEINRFNMSSLTCRMIQDGSGKPHVLYSAVLTAGEPRRQMLADINAWRSCIGDFGAFLKDPTGYLASAP